MVKVVYVGQHGRLRARDWPHVPDVITARLCPPYCWSSLRITQSTTQLPIECRIKLVQVQRARRKLERNVHDRGEGLHGGPLSRTRIYTYT